MKLRFVDPNSLDKNLKATIHRSGKLGFTVEAAKKLKLADSKSAGIAFNEDDALDINLYMEIKADFDENYFKINKAGEYYFLNTKAFFDSINLDYINDTVVYDILPIKVDGKEYFRFKRRPSKKTKRPSQPMSERS